MTKTDEESWFDEARAGKMPLGTKLIVKDIRNPDGSLTITDRYLLFPDGSKRHLRIVDETSEMPQR